MPRLLYLVSEDWYFLSHRLPMARAARDAGYEVHVATRVAKGADAIRTEGFTLHEMQWQRGSLNPLNFLNAVVAVRALYKTAAPALVHHVALWPSVVGSFAALGLPVRRLSALAGLGFAYTSQSPKARIVRGILGPVLRFLFNRSGSAVLVQNPDDRAALTAIGIDDSRVFLIPGSGIDTDKLLPLPEPNGPVTMAYVGRLLDDKGLRPLVKAQALLNASGRPVRLLIAGDPDPANPASIPPDEIAAWRHQPGVELLGHVKDISTVWERAQIAVLPSRREGLPKSLLEAAACGRPMVATDVPGCREIARQDINALLVPPDAPEALADAVDRLAGDTELRRRFGAAGRQMAETEFSSQRIGAAIVALYGQMLTQDVLAVEPRDA